MKDKNNKLYYVLIGRTLLIGVFGGLFWGGIGWLMYFFNFTEVAAKTFVLRSWMTKDWTNSWIGDITSMLIVILLSVVVSFVYFLLFRKLHSLWIGLFFGLILWGGFFLLLYPLFPHVKPLSALKVDTMITTACLFILYGTFIGYSIAYEYYSLIQYKKRKNKVGVTTS